MTDNEDSSDQFACPNDDDGDDDIQQDGKNIDNECFKKFREKDEGAGHAR
jgi:hypothetical protein